jgi:hypothetical protein
MRCPRVLVAIVFAAAVPVSVQAQALTDHFDTYTAGTPIAGQGGWETWDNAPGANANVVNNQSFTTPNSLRISGAADIVHTFTGVNSGIWYARVQTFVPSTSTGELFFILLNQYVSGSPASDNWSVQLALCRTGCSTLGTVPGFAANLGGSDVVGSATAPLVLDQWVEARVEINFGTNTYSIFYNHQLMETLAWTQTGTLQLQAVDLFSNAINEGYMDSFHMSTVLPVDLTTFQVE